VTDFRLASTTVILAELGGRLRQQRLARVWTQQDLSARAGVALSAVKKLESGGNATLRTMIKVTQAMSLTHDLAETFAARVSASIAEMERAARAPRKRARPPRARPSRGPEPDAAA
jgi:transcriptional regulator with XRE-family HTH domain